MAKTNEAWSPTINGLDYLVRNIGDRVVCRWVVNTRPRYAKMSTMAKNHLAEWGRVVSDHAVACARSRAGAK